MNVNLPEAIHTLRLKKGVTMVDFFIFLRYTERA